MYTVHGLTLAFATGDTSGKREPLNDVESMPDLATTPSKEMIFEGFPITYNATRKRKRTALAAEMV